MLGFTSKQLLGVGIFLFAIFIGVPLVIGATGRWDFYFTLTSVALLAIASVTLWFFGQRAFMESLGLPYLNFTAEPWVGDDDWQRRWFLNPFGWQLVFFTGFSFAMGWLPAPPEAISGTWQTSRIALS